MNQCKKCLKSYQHRQSLWKHKQKCSQSKVVNDVQITSKQYQVRLPAKKAVNSDDQIGNHSLNTDTPSQYIDSNNESSMNEMDEDEISSYSLKKATIDAPPQDNDDSSMEEEDEDGISSYALNEPVIRRHCIWLLPNTRAQSLLVNLVVKK